MSYKCRETIKELNLNKPNNIVDSVLKSTSA